MDPTTTFNIFIIFAFIGFATDAIWGMELFKFFSDGAAMLLISVISFITIGITKDPSLAFNLMDTLMAYFQFILIPMLVGDILGTVLSRILKVIAVRLNL